MEIDYIKGFRSSEIFGTARCEFEINQRLDGGVNFNYIEYAPKDLRINVLSALGSNIGYTLSVMRKVKDENVKHINPQSYSYILNFLNLKKTIVTCHDLIPWVYEKDRSILSKFNIRGLKKADTIITVSNFTKSEVIKYLDFPEDKIHVIHNAVDHAKYYKKRDQYVRNRFNIPSDFKVILYVGSEQPRQNIPVIIKAFAKVKKRLNNVKFIKVGIPQFLGAREKNLELIDQLNLRSDIIFVDRVPENDLRRYYNAADLFVYPCSYAGFGLPPLEAMACGTPVITSNTTSLPEVVGDAGVLIDPCDVDLMADKMFEILVNRGLSEEMIKEGLNRAKMFNWDKAAEETLNVYKKVYYGD